MVQRFFLFPLGLPPYLIFGLRIDPLSVALLLAKEEFREAFTPLANVEAMNLFSVGYVPSRSPAYRSGSREVAHEIHPQIEHLLSKNRWTCS